MEKWEEEFDRIFVDENVWQGEDDYTKNVPIGNIKKFIETLLEEHDTYWKERVRKVLPLRMGKANETGHDMITQYVDGFNACLDTRLENLTKVE